MWEATLSSGTLIPSLASATEGGRSAALLDGGSAYFCIELFVHQGAIGLVFLDTSGAEIGECHIDTTETPLVAIPFDRAAVPALDGCSLRIRNVGAAGETVFSVGRIWTAPTRPVPLPSLTLGRNPFPSFRRWQGRTPAGYWSDWLGQMTRIDYFVSDEESRRQYLVDRPCDQPDLPIDSEHILDRLPLLESVLRARETFTVVSLGAGWGRWLAAGWLAALQRGLSTTLVGVEAEPTHFEWLPEPTHFEWLHEHLSGNGVPDDAMHLWHAAAASVSGEVAFATGGADHWWG